MVADYVNAGELGPHARGLVVLGRGRTEISLVVTVPYADRAAADVVERKLAKLLVSRIVA